MVYGLRAALEYWLGNIPPPYFAVNTGSHVVFHTPMSVIGLPALNPAPLEKRVNGHGIARGRNSQPDYSPDGRSLYPRRQYL
ncbi:hypothetical protein HYU09_02835 [Candidatus Woesearchaeota archaeon]|nr:hypothetical protein [Candidatus Woesearchaeota archaeon]